MTHTVRSPRQPTSPLILSLLTAAVVCLIILAVGEIAARIFVPPQRLALPLDDTAEVDFYKSNPFLAQLRPYLHYHIPGSRYTAARAGFRVQYDINRLGFRGPDPGAAPPAGVKRLVVVGDSMVEGHGIEFADTFSARLDKKLRAHGWQALNLGMQGGSPVYYASNLPRYLSLKPDVVLLVLFDNDLRDDRVRESNFFDIPRADDDGALVAVSGSSGLSSASRLWIFLRNAWRDWVAPPPVERIVARNLREAPGQDTEQTQMKRISDYLIAPSKHTAHWQLTRRYLEHIADTLQTRGVKLCLAYLSVTGLAPGLPEVHRTHTLLFEQALEQWAAEHETAFLSLVPAMDKRWQQATAPAVIIPEDGHPRPATHAMLADTIYSWLLHQLADNSLSSVMPRH